MYGKCSKCGRDTLLDDTGLCYACDYEELRKTKEKNNERKES